MVDLSSNLVSMLNASVASAPAVPSNSPSQANQAGGFSDALKNATSERTPVDEPMKPVSAGPAASAEPAAPKAKLADAKKPEEAPPTEESSETVAASEGEVEEDAVSAKAEGETAESVDRQPVQQDPLANPNVAQAQVVPATNVISAAFAAKAAIAVDEQVDTEGVADDAAAEAPETQGTASAENNIPGGKLAVATQAAVATSALPAEKAVAAESNAGAVLGAAQATPEFTTSARAAELEKAATVTQNKQPAEALRSFSELFDQSSGKMVSDLSGRAELIAAPVTARAAALAPGQTLPIGAALHETEWGNAVAKRVTWMVGRDIQNAELRLDPPELGRINVRISMTQDQASVSFASPHGTVREAVEAALPKLRDMLAENGYTLAHVDISSQFQQRQGEQPGRRNGSGGGAAYGDEVEPEVGLPVVRLGTDGLIDAYV